MIISISMTEQELITRLIKDDLVNYRLVMGLNNLGLVAEQYFLHTSEVIFVLMKFSKENQEGYSKYEKLKAEILKYNLASKPEKLDELADRIYSELESYRLLNKSTLKVKNRLKRSI